MWADLELLAVWHGWLRCPTPRRPCTDTRLRRPLALTVCTASTDWPRCESDSDPRRDRSAGRPSASSERAPVRRWFPLRTWPTGRRTPSGCSFARWIAAESTFDQLHRTIVSMWETASVRLHACALGGAGRLYGHRQRLE